MLKKVILIYINVKFNKYVSLILIKYNLIKIKLKSLDLYFLKLNYLKLNYLFYLFNINIFLFKKIKKNIITTLNSSHMSNIKSKEQFSVMILKVDYFFNKCYFFINFLNYKLFNFLLLNIVSVSLNNNSKLSFFIKK